MKQDRARSSWSTWHAHTVQTEYHLASICKRPRLEGGMSSVAWKPEVHAAGESDSSCRAFMFHILMFCCTAVQLRTGAPAGTGVPLWGARSVSERTSTFRHTHTVVRSRPSLQLGSEQAAPGQGGRDLSCRHVQAVLLNSNRRDGAEKWWGTAP